MAGGDNTYSKNYSFCKGYLLPAQNSVNMVNVQLNNLQKLWDLDIQHVLPDHPSTVGDSVVVITGEFKGQLRKVFQVNTDGTFVVGDRSSKTHQLSTTHHRKDLVLVKVVEAKKKKKI